VKALTRKFQLTKKSLTYAGHESEEEAEEEEEESSDGE